MRLTTPGPPTRTGSRSLPLTATLALAVISLSTAALACCALSGPGWRGPVTDHFDGRTFRNLPNPELPERIPLLRWLLHRDPGQWPAVVAVAPAPAPPERVWGGALRVTFVNHSTFLLQTAGANLLIDPIWSERASPVGFAGPARVHDPGLRLEDLPPLDGILVSHDHYDHLDLETIRRLTEGHPGVPLYVGLGVGAYLAAEGVPGAVEMDWWDRQALPAVPGVGVVCTPAQHNSGRGLTGRNTTLWAGFLITTPGGDVFFAGDTGFGPHFRTLRERFGPPRLALLPIGAYKPRAFMAEMHMDPWEAVVAHRVLGAEWSIAAHFGTFPMADDGYADPTRDLERALIGQRVPRRRFRALDPGGHWDVPRSARAETPPYRGATNAWAAADWDLSGAR